MESFLNGRRQPVDVVRDILKIRFPEALFAFVAGSFQRGEATISSDIDLVVIFEKLDFAWRESFIFEGWPVEAFVHDPETLNYFFNEVDGKDGQLSLPSMVSEAVVVPFDSEKSQQLKKMAEKLLAQNAPKWSDETIYHQRYGITDLIDDLRTPRNKLEANIVIGALHETLGNFYFRSRSLWSASKKHIPRQLLKHDRVLGERWIDSFSKAYAGEYANLIALTEEIVNPYGGLFFDGYKRTAPKEWRIPVVL
ncbi:MAG: hypothetical protein A2504_17845 [Bdellovibrionales bacterium RIFOXYD12_FULL_39_22]|nr:MAG: hypothetical protein A2385_15185 [Bdellovibrionales bacterium RIFOXYB1_FULL_39_21]OFZ48565.1 MAG: hypothetical protein A2404_17490 [Bdellovibrionales bacterium RIFOXYC1_FULL_39_130]OFZ76666.1 MAG: hypothetical protein A2560_04855 [Bdellovibrionales bacterium RIFOXYD1_FULL_39_84]OFZ95883.1 MAG: hypothetical protein A2504_17845 [Bdellovibrionales bacterium RIFOXYD12_FULL_39_22]HLE12141.1 nucleotidyltransferase domain-containing protein [Bacteriovoracaceae bacterium]